MSMANAASGSLHVPIGVNADANTATFAIEQTESCLSITNLEQEKPKITRAFMSHASYTFCMPHTIYTES